MFRFFIDQVLPNASNAERTLASDLVMDTLSAVGQQFSQEPRTDKEIKAYAGGLADMLCAYLAGLAGQNTARKVKRTVRGSPG